MSIKLSSKIIISLTLVFVTIALVVSIFLSSGLYTGVMSAFSTNRILYVLPDNFEGWVRIYYYEKKCLPISDDENIILIDKNGYGCTSSEYPYGWYSREYFYQNSINKKDLMSYGLIHAESVVEKKDVKIKVELFFVGPKDLLNKNWKNKPIIRLSGN